MPVVRALAVFERVVCVCFQTVRGASAGVSIQSLRAVRGEQAAELNGRTF